MEFNYIFELFILNLHYKILMKLKIKYWRCIVTSVKDVTCIFQLKILYELGTSIHFHYIFIL
jgi:hypothetical protein